MAENAAIAAKLKQLAARLLASYQKQRLEVTSIRVEVQVSEAAPHRAATSKAKSLSIETIENLERLSEQLEDSPLKEAVARMAARQRRQS